MIAAVLGTLVANLAIRRTGKVLMGTVIGDQVIDGRIAKKKLELTERSLTLGLNAEKEKWEKEMKIENPAMVVRVTMENLPHPQTQWQCCGEYLWTEQEMKTVLGLLWQDADMKTGKLQEPYFDMSMLPYLLHVGRARMQDQQLYSAVVKPEETSKIFWSFVQQR